MIIGVTVVVVILIVYTVSISLDQERTLRNGTLHVIVENDNSSSEIRFDLYLDSVLKVDDRRVEALGGESLFFSCTWYDAQSDTVKVSLHDSDDRWHYRNVSVPSEGIAFASFAI